MNRATIQVSMGFLIQQLELPRMTTVHGVSFDEATGLLTMLVDHPSLPLYTEGQEPAKATVEFQVVRTHYKVYT